ncbi:TonB-dependent receptor [Foetidibacter luteolus]|uniref:TonB-dependent receptor n=1 Tax=Foetidibacter luteolus TaxID=2608880 RepID=UPI00129BC806|nr:TonB-dependent receptor [Foetidibacter luteolus]
MNQLFRKLLVITLLLFSVGLYAQTKTISGTITDANGSAVDGATIKSLPSGTSTISGSGGKFSLTVPQADAKLQITALNFQVYESNLSERSAFSVVLVSSSASLQEVVLVGTRSSGRTRLNTPVPVDVFNIGALQLNTAQNDVNQLLQYASPSFNSNRQSSSDGTEHIDPASIRGLGPDQVLVLINGKRRHTTSLVNNQGTIGNGSVGTDLNAIPASAIERIEVLRDGAAAQYGSDAIAGVINVVLKKNTNKLFASVTGGATSEGDGGLGQLNLNYGTSLGRHGGYLNVTAEAFNRGKTSRSQNHNLIIFDQSSLDNYFAYDFTSDPAASRKYDDDQLAQKDLKRDDFNFQVGNAHIKNIAAFINLSLPFKSGKGEFYAFGGYNYRRGEGFGFRRLPSDYSVNVYSIFPNGFQPNTGSDIHDRSLVAGIKFRAGEWNGDFSNTIGNNRFDFSVNNTVNASLESASPTSFKAGGHEFLQNTTNLDFSRLFKGIGSGLSLAFGAEFRVDDYRIRSGEEASWKNYALVTNPDGTVSNPSGLAGGSQSFPGFSPDNAVHKSRNNFSLYADAELDVTAKWLIGGATRFERYSDFGSTLNGKLTTRYKVTNGFAVRGAISTGFRAPSLHQQSFSYISTNILPDNRLGQAGFFPSNSALAKALGIPQLKQETSLNYSLGITATPVKNLTISVDGYLINIKDRIVLTGSFGYDPFGDPVQEIQDILNPLGASSARFFSNAVDTRTIGLDLVADYSIRSGNHSFNVSLGININKNSITASHVPGQLKGQEQIFFSPADSSLIVEGTPRSKANLSLTYGFKKFSVTLRNVYFGQVTRNGFPFGDIQKHKGKIVTDLSLGYKILNNVTLTVGANNLFNVFPDEQIYANSYFGVFKYAPVQMGMDGAFYFGRLTFNLPTAK